MSRWFWFGLGVLACSACGARTSVFVDLDAPANAGSGASSGGGAPNQGFGGTGVGGTIGVAGSPNAAGMFGVGGSSAGHAGNGSGANNPVGGDAGFGGSPFGEAGAAGSAGVGAAALCDPACADGSACESRNGHTACALLLAPRPIAPLSTARVTSRMPLFRWTLGAGGDGAIVDLYRDRACTQLVYGFYANGTSGAPGSPLDPGVYYWRLRGAYRGLPGLQAGPVWEVIVGQGSAPLNSSWGTNGDFNGDGYSDVVNGTADNDSLTGTAQIHFGGPSGAAIAQSTLAAPDKTAVFPKFGASVASAGDVNGDGFADLVVGAPGGTHQPGAAYVYLGGAAGLPASPSTILPSTAPNGAFGWSVSSAGDVNGDGYADVAVVEFGSGLTHIYLGNADGTLTTHLSYNSPRGSVVASAGDVNGDGFGDFVVGSFQAGNKDAGMINLYLGGPQGPATPIEIDNPTGIYGFFGYSVSGAGDVNGDGYADVLVGAPGIIPLAYVYLGSSAGLGSAPITLKYNGAYVDNLSIPSSEYGAALSGAGDVNGDGYDDIVVSAPFDRTLYSYLGGAGGLSTTPTLVHDGQSQFATSVAGGGDVNGDGFSDVLAGSRGVAYPAQLGYFVVLPGSASGLLSPQVYGDIGDTEALAY